MEISFLQIQNFKSIENMILRDIGSALIHPPGYRICPDPGRAEQCGEIFHSPGHCRCYGRISAFLFGL